MKSYTPTVLLEQGINFTFSATTPKNTIPNIFRRVVSLQNMGN